MPAIANVEIVENAVGRWAPSDIAFIRELTFLGSESSLESSLTSQDTPLLRLRCLLQPRPPLSQGWPDLDGAFWLVELLFSGVRELAIAQSGTGDLQITGFEIIDHSKSQLEGLRLEVRDYEEGRISFWARGGSVVSCHASSSRPTCSPVSRQFAGPARGH